MQEVAHELAALTILRREHLLPGLHRGVGRAEALEIAAVIAAVELAHAGLQKLRHVGLEDLAVGVLGVDAHAEVVVVRDGADMLRKLVVALEVGLEVLQIVRLRLRRGKRAHHVVHNVVGVDGVEVMLLPIALVLRMDAHHRTDHAGHVHALSFDGQRIARERILLHAVDVGLDAVAQRQNERDADDTNAAGEGRQKCPSLFRHQVVERERQRRAKAHRWLFLLSLRRGLFRSAGIGRAVVHDLAVL